MPILIRSKRCAGRSSSACAWTSQQRGVDVTGAFDDRITHRRVGLYRHLWFSSVGGMLLLSGIINLPFIFTAQRFTVMNRWIRVVGGVASVTFGIFFRLGNRFRVRILLSFVEVFTRQFLLVALPRA